ncbi:hypothetical protein PTKIN_Ptkin01aG0065700 [Pterospermum kingtungense]
MRDENGSFIACQTVTKLGILSVKEVEAFGLLEALQWIRCMGWFNVVVEMDAKSVVDVVLESRFDASELGLSVAECRSLNFPSICS